MGPKAKKVGKLLWRLLCLAAAFGFKSARAKAIAAAAQNIVQGAVDEGLK